MLCQETPCDGSGGFNLPNFNVSGITVTLGLLFLPIGLAMALAGYRLWKYVVFILGFIIIGGICAGLALAQWAATADPTNSDPDLQVVLAFLIGGVLGGFCFIAMYFIVIFCAGCGCGMAIFGVVILAVVGSTTDPSADLLDMLGLVDVVCGIMMGVVFIYFQKVCIMLGTSYMGSNIVTSCIFYGIVGAYDQTVVLALLTLAGTACGFYVQWNYTGKGVEIDPRTGQVTVVVVPGQPQPAIMQRLDRIAGLQPGQAVPAVTAGVQWQQVPATQVQQAWAQPPQQQQGMQAPLIQAAPGMQAVPPAVPTMLTPAASPASPITPGPTTLAEFCAVNKFTTFEAALSDLGVSEAPELEDVTDAQLTAIGFNAIQLKRLRKQVPAAAAAPAAPSTQTTVNIAAVSPQPQQASQATTTNYVDQSVEVSATNTTGGSE